MLQNLFKLASVFILGLLISCSGSDGDAPSKQVVVSATGADNGSLTASNNTNTGNVTGSETGTPASSAGDTGSDTTSTGDTTPSTTETNSTSGDATDTGINTTDAGADATAGTGTDDPDATTEGDTTETTDATGTATDGTATGGATTTTDTDAGNDSAGTDEGATAGTTGTDDGTTAGADTDGTVTTDPGYPLGSLANQIVSEGNLGSALKALQDANLDLSIDDPMNEWTLFLPTDEAIAALDLPSDFVLRRHIATGAVSSTTLSALNGRMLNMNNGDALIVDGGGTQDLTIAGATVIKSDIQGNLTNSVVHIIDTVIVDDTGNSPYTAGSLADVLFNRGDMTIALDGLQTAGLIEAINDPTKLWTLFLPVDSALDDPADFVSQVHIYTLGANDSEFLTGISGLPLLMSSNDIFAVGGGGTEPLTIGGIEIIEEDVQNEDSEGSFVHIIDGVLVP